MTRTYNHCKRGMTVVGFEPTNPLPRDSGSQSRRVCQFRHTVARLGGGERRADRCLDHRRPAAFSGRVTEIQAASGNSSVGYQSSPRFRIFSASRSRLRQVRTVRSLIFASTSCAASTMCTPAIPGVALMHCSTTIIVADGGRPRFERGGLSGALSAAPTRSWLADVATAAMASRQPFSYAWRSASAIKRSISCLGSLMVRIAVVITPTRAARRESKNKRFKIIAREIHSPETRGEAISVSADAGNGFKCSTFHR